MSRSVIAELFAPPDNEQVIVAVAGGEPFREHHGRDRLVTGNQSVGETRHRPPAPAISRRARAVPRGRNHPPAELRGHESVFYSSCHTESSPSIGEARKTSDKPSDNDPR
jgi:hypothetical protein